MSELRKKYKRRRGGTFLKVMLGVMIGGLVLIVGCVALIAGGVNEAEQELEAQGITRAEFRSIEQGTTQEDVPGEWKAPLRGRVVPALLR